MRGNGYGCGWSCIGTDGSPLAAIGSVPILFAGIGRVYRGRGRRRGSGRRLQHRRLEVFPRTGAMPTIYMTAVHDQQQVVAAPSTNRTQPKAIRSAANNSKGYPWFVFRQPSPPDLLTATAYSRRGVENETAARPVWAAARYASRPSRSERVLNRSRIVRTAQTGQKFDGPWNQLAGVGSRFGCAASHRSPLT